MIFHIIGFAILIYSVFRFKPGFMLYLAYKLLLVTNVTLVSEPGLPLLSLEVFMNLAYIALFFFNKRKCNCTRVRFPYTGVFVGLVFAWLVASVFSVAGFAAEFTTIVKMIAEQIIFIWMMWYMVEDEDDFALVYKYITIVMFAVCLYGLYEYVAQVNPLVDFEYNMVKDKTKAIVYEYTTEARGYRIRSVFEHPIGAGMNWGIYAALTLWLWVNKKLKGITFANVFAILTAGLSVLCIVLSKMRSPLIFFVICCLSLLKFKKKRTYILVVAGVVLCAVALPLLADKLTVLTALFDSDAAESIGGSSFSMRVGQYVAGLELMWRNPLSGLGFKYESVLDASVYKAVLGRESVWLGVMIMNGIIGIIAYVVYAFYSVVVLGYKYKSWSIFWFMAAYWITYTISSLPGWKMYLLYLVMFYFIKSSPRYAGMKEWKARLCGRGVKKETSDGV